MQTGQAHQGMEQTCKCCTRWLKWSGQGTSNKDPLSFCFHLRVVSGKRRGLGYSTCASLGLLGIRKSGTWRPGEGRILRGNIYTIWEIEPTLETLTGQASSACTALSPWRSPGPCGPWGHLGTHCDSGPRTKKLTAPPKIVMNKSDEYESRNTTSRNGGHLFCFVF